MVNKKNIISTEKNKGGEYSGSFIFLKHALTLTLTHPLTLPDQIVAQKKSGSVSGSFRFQGF